MIKNFIEITDMITVRRFKHPLLGVFVSSWILCNWNHLLILFWGQGSLEERVNSFAFKLNHTVFFSFNSLFWLPFLLTVIYTFILPWILVAAKYLLMHSNRELHKQNVSLELSYYEAEESLNIAKTLANPNKEFIEELAKLEIQRRKDEQDKIAAMAKETAANAKKSEIQVQENQLKLDAEVLRQKLEKSQNEAALKKAMTEKAKFDAEFAIQKATENSNRFPILFNLIKNLEESLQEDGINVSLSTLSELIAIVYGYSSANDLLNDSQFNNESFEKIKFIYAHNLSKDLIKWGQNHYDADDIDFFHDHLILLFQDHQNKILLFDENSVSEEVLSFCNESQYDIVNSDEVTGSMAETDTIFDDFSFDYISQAYFDDSKGYYWQVEGEASGYHRKETDIPGQSIALKVTIQAPIVLGEFGLGNLKIVDIDSEPIY